MRNLPPIEEIPATVPADYIEHEYVDKDLETFACLDGSLLVDGYSMRAPSLGVFSILEAFDCKAIGDPQNAGLEDFVRVLYVNHHRETCVNQVQQWITEKGAEYVRGSLPQDTKEWHEFDKKVIVWGEKECFFGRKTGETDEQLGKRIASNIEQVSKWMDVCFTGFKMMPPGASGGTHLFGATAISGIVAGIGKCLNVSYTEVLWDTPITLIGHTVAQTARSNGMEGIARPKDKDDIKAKLQMAKQTQRDGKLLPWQIDDPLNHRLSDFQKAYFPKLEKELERLQEQARKK